MKDKDSYLCHTWHVYTIYLFWLLFKAVVINKLFYGVKYVKYYIVESYSTFVIYTVFYILPV